jgi:hypothetical protein
MKSSSSTRSGALWVSLLALCLAAPVLAQAPAVGQVTVASSSSSRLFSPSVAFADGRNVLVLWEDSDDGIAARRIGPGGRLGQAVQIAANDLPAAIPYNGPITLQRDPVVVPLDAGDFLAIWKQERQHVNVDILFQDSRVIASTIQTRHFNRAGLPDGRQLALSEGDLGLESAPRAVRLASGRLAVVWQTQIDRDPAGIYGRLVGGRGVPHGTLFRIDDPLGEAGERPALTALADGGFVVAWQQCCDAGGDPDVVARRFDAEGVALGGPFVVNAGTDGLQVWPAIAAGVDGDLMVAWMGPGANQQGREYRVYGQKVSADGARLGDERVLSSGVGRAHGAPTLAALPDGYALVWTLWREHFVGGIYGVALDSDGAQRADAVKVSSGSVQFQWELALSTDSAGRVLAAWQGFNREGDAAINFWSLIPDP